MSVRVKVLKAPGYRDEWEGSLIASVRTLDGRPLSVIEYDAVDNPYNEPPAVIASEYVRLIRGSESDVPRFDALDPTDRYAECGCIAPCPDHSPRDVSRGDRDYWNNRHTTEGENTSDDQ